jgi:hypothetical protein
MFAKLKNLINFKKHEQNQKQAGKISGKKQMRKPVIKPKKK